MTDITIIGALVLGLMGAGHCVGMCGGIISSLSMATGDNNSKWSKIILYQLGRITSYTVFGIVAGWIGFQTQQLSPIPILKILSGILLILMGLYVSRLWMAITYLEKMGKLLWNKISPLTKKLLPVTTKKRALLLGMLWGWLPCGLVYTSLSYAITMAHPLNSGLFMLMFGLGTLPATLLAGAASANLKTWLNITLVRYSSALFFVGFGVFILYDLFSSGNTVHHH